MAITARVSRIVWGQCAGRCCICRRDVIFKAEGKLSLLGEVAHIVGETKAAARGISPLNLGERNQEDNLLLLCRDDHKIVDDDPDTYPVERLTRIKADHVRWIGEQLVKLVPWESNLAQLCYINVPRLCEQAELRGLRVDLAAYRSNRTLHSLGWELNQVMGAFRDVLPKLTVNASPIENIALHESFIGAPVAFDRHRFRTKNIHRPDEADAASIPATTGSLESDPHIYLQLRDFRVVLTIDLRWITTTTAFVLFRPSAGQSVLSGLGIVTMVDYESKVLWVTPWVIGLPRSPLDDFHVPPRSKIVGPPQGTNLEQLVDLDRAKQKETYFIGPPAVCDGCRTRLLDHRYMIDCKLRGNRGWGCLCPECHAENGTAIAWGTGQLYLNESGEWLLVAGFPPVYADDAE